MIAIASARSKRNTWALAAGAVLVSAAVAGMLGTRLGSTPEAASTANVAETREVGESLEADSAAAVTEFESTAFSTVTRVAADLEAAASQNSLDSEGVELLVLEIDRLAGAIDDALPDGPGDALRAAGAALLSVSETTPQPSITGFAPFVLQYPVPGYNITDSFGTIRGPDVHNGIDIGAPPQTPILAAAAGVVLEAGWLSDTAGNGVILGHEGGWETRYFHMASSDLPVSTGDQVDPGQLIGYVGTTGLSTGPHLHFEIVFGPLRMNPESGFTYVGR